MTYKVIKFFRDNDDKDIHGNKRLNEPGQTYPHEGLEVTEERTAYLQDKGFIEHVADDAKEDEEFPMHKGGGNYVLSNGESVKGKDAAIEAEQALKVEDQPKDGE